MAPAIPLISAVVGAAMSYKSYREQKKAASAQEQIGRQNAAFKEAETREAATRLRENQRRVLAEARATAGATGVAGGSEDIYMADIARTQERELSWTEKAGMSQANIMRQEAKLKGDIGRAAAQSTLYSGMAGLIEGGAETYSKGKTAGWWGG